MTAAALGVVINPVAGMGGRVGLHGTDGPAFDAALRRGAVPVAAPRARRVLTRLQRRLPSSVRTLCAGGEMGARLLDDLAWPHDVVLEPAEPSTAADTTKAVAAMCEQGVSLVLFVGGDGTARDVVAGAGDRPVLGVPAGVKMHSAVFARTPEAAADAAAAFLADPATARTTVADVVDLVDLVGAQTPEFLGTARVPAAGATLQQAKAGRPTDDDAELAALGREVAAEMSAERLYLLGPGSTVAHVSTALGLPATLLGVDAVVDGRLVASDLDEAGLHSLLDAHPDAALVLGVVGGQGFLLGRGNQQLSAAVIERIGADRVVILASAAKVAALDAPVLHVDLGDDAPVVPLSGYHRVRTGPRRSTVLRIAG